MQGSGKSVLHVHIVCPDHTALLPSQNYHSTYWKNYLFFPLVIYFLVFQLKGYTEYPHLDKPKGGRNSITGDTFFFSVYYCWVHCRSLNYISSSSWPNWLLFIQDALLGTSYMKLHYHYMISISYHSRWFYLNFQDSELLVTWLLHI